MLSIRSTLDGKPVPILMGNHTVSVVLELGNNPTFRLGKSCPFPDVENAVKSILASYRKLLTSKGVT